MKQIVVGVGIALSLVVVLGLSKYVKIARAIEQSQKFGPPPETVTASAAQQETWHDVYRAVGSVVPVQGVTMSAEEPGKVVNLGFESGAFVKKGDLLVELDTSVEEGNLNAAVARQEQALRELNRAKTLKGSQAVSQDEVDRAESRYRQSSAEVQSLRGMIARKKILAPFSGRTGIRMVNLGQYVVAGTPLVPLQTLDPIYVNFSLPQQRVSDLAVGQKVSLSVDAFPTENFVGTISTINPQVDEITRNVMVQALFENTHEKLRPGMFATLEVQLPRQVQLITLPATSINYAPYGDSVYVIEATRDAQQQEVLKVRRQLVRVKEKRGEQVAIVSGLKAGELVVTSAGFKLRPGAIVKVNDQIKPGNDPAPQPADS